MVSFQLSVVSFRMSVSVIAALELCGILTPNREAIRNLLRVANGKPQIPCAKLGGMEWQLHVTTRKRDTVILKSTRAARDLWLNHVENF